jgi:hypothetical protein
MAPEERPNKFEKVKAEYTKQKEEELKFDMKHHRKMPDFDKHEAVVKLTSAAIHREGHQLK